jgi:hypothetical protein
MKVSVYDMNDGLDGWAAECVLDDGAREKAIFFGDEAETQARDWAKRYGVASKMKTPKVSVPAFMIAGASHRSRRMMASAFRF